LTINRTTFLNALSALHTAAGVKEISEDSFYGLYSSMLLTSDEAVTMINEAQRDGLVHLRWRGWVTLTERGRDAAEGRGTATYANPAAFEKAGAASEIRLDAAAGRLFGAAQALIGDGETHDAVEKAKGAVASLALAASSDEPDKNVVAKRLSVAKASLAALGAAAEASAPAVSEIDSAAKIVAGWAGVA